ncbi:hypothetical protein ACFQ21_17080 [Ohtaekwangia kribbensis]|uniref:Uncharacterized protein n=1 Tax=Ohtaekwangia kribbensis TaxID=688913 RepID=A0ABW3K502_9BACT
MKPISDISWNKYWWKTKMEVTVLFNCYLSDRNSEKTVCTFKIILTKNRENPFHLYKLENIVLDQWQKLNINTTMNGAVRTLLQELFSSDINKAIHYGQLVLNTQGILKKIINGKMAISIGTADTKELLTPDFDFILEELIENQVTRP